jgi:hypothetical protein
MSDTSKFCSLCGAKVKNPIQTHAQQTYHTAPPVALSAVPHVALSAAPNVAPAAPASGRRQPPKSNALPFILIAGGVFAAGIIIMLIIIVSIFMGANKSNYDSYRDTEYYQAPAYNDNSDIFVEDPFVEDPFAADPFAEDPFAYDEYDSEYPADDYVITDQQDTCISCYGSGYCDDCNGTGQYSMYGNPLDTCPSCDGDGICSICDGLGYY